MTSHSLSTQVAQTVGITLSAAAGGACLAISVVAIPAVLQAPYPLVVRQWNTAYEISKRTIPTTALVASAAHGFLAYGASGTPAAKLYVAAAVAGLSMAPYTLLLMAGTNGSLKRKLKETQGVAATEVVSEVEAKAAGEPSSKQLLDRWVSLNVVRAMLPLSGALLGVYAALS